ncbi:hypothetical protein BC826DRAFT_1105335 [Russula brevipes]|nr:hypothetical protein BC826DRAFT_1105335 [Russula brevipes]
MASFFQNIYLVFPTFSNAEPAHHNVQATGTMRPSEEPIYFYDSHKPYYESAKPSLASLPLSPLMLGCFVPRHQIYELLRLPRRISQPHLSNRRAPFQAFKFMDTDPVLAEHVRGLPTARMAQQEAKKQHIGSAPTGWTSMSP